jgi:RND superfamily putative drug exporter
VGAAYGLLVLVFQHSWAEGILGFHSNGAITSWLPLFMFVILFGLSMDYHVFILSRVKELVDEGMPTEQAVSVGIKRTASTVTSAAVVMVGVFAIFMTLRTLDIKQMGFGLAAAILIDATIVRAVLLPSLARVAAAVRRRLVGRARAGAGRARPGPGAAGRALAGVRVRIAPGD